MAVGKQNGPDVDSKVRPPRGTCHQFHRPSSSQPLMCQSAVAGEHCRAKEALRTADTQTEERTNHIQCSPPHLCPRHSESLVWYISISSRSIS